VNVVVFGEEELTVTTRIGKDGAINMPMVGLVRLAGQTIREAATTLERELREYLVKPQVSVTIVQYTKRKITILGQVNRPGTYEMPDETSVNIVEAIGMAGGYTRIANPKKITIKRTIDGRDQTIRLDGKGQGEGNSTERMEILPGDTITVGERIF
jgi:polysaccharide export outer membrane protein